MDNRASEIGRIIIGIVTHPRVHDDTGNECSDDDSADENGERVSGILSPLKDGAMRHEISSESITSSQLCDARTCLSISRLALYLTEC